MITEWTVAKSSWVTVVSAHSFTIRRRTIRCFHQTLITPRLLFPSRTGGGVAVRTVASLYTAVVQGSSGNNNKAGATEESMFPVLDVSSWALRWGAWQELRQAENMMGLKWGRSVKRHSRRHRAVGDWDWMRPNGNFWRRRTTGAHAVQYSPPVLNVHYYTSITNHDVKCLYTLW